MAAARTMSMHARPCCRDPLARVLRVCRTPDRRPAACTPDGNGITYNERINVALAVAMPDGGLITPVLKDADKVRPRARVRACMHVCVCVCVRGCATAAMWVGLAAARACRAPRASCTTWCGLPAVLERAVWSLTARIHLCHPPATDARPPCAPDGHLPAVAQLGRPGQARARQAAGARRVQQRHVHHLQPGHVWRGHV
jgi:hypothetical protein